MVQPPFEIFLVPTWLRVPIWSGTLVLKSVCVKEYHSEINLFATVYLREYKLFCSLAVTEDEDIAEEDPADYAEESETEDEPEKDQENDQEGNYR